MTASSLRRLHVLAYALIGSLLGPLLAQILARLSRTVSQLMPGLDQDYVTTLQFIAGFGAVIFFTSLLKPRWRHFVHAWKYAPTVLAVPTAAVFLGIAAKTTSWGLFDLNEVIAVGTSAFFYAGCVIAWCRWQAARSQNISVESSAKITDWLRNEGPINQSDEDRLNFSHRAERIVAALTTERIAGTRQMQTVLVHGPFGSGKTSLVNLAREKARGQKLLFVSINCWGFESSTRAREYVIGKCVEALGEVVDCTALRAVPQHYVDAIGTAGTWAQSIAALFGSAPSPRQVLTAFEPVLSAIDYQLVAVVEDADRNGADFDASHIESMLHDFRSAPRLSFILTVGANARIEFPKVAEVIEFLPTIPLHAVLRHLDDVRLELRNQAPYIDPPAGIQNNRWHRPNSLRRDAESPERLSVFAAQYRIWPECVAKLITTPRKLKSFLSALRRDWPSLRGEVDLDEWIMVVALRHAAGAAFTYLGSNLDDLRRASSIGRTDTAENKAAHNQHISTLRARWEDVVKESDFDREAAEVLIAELIPAALQVFPERPLYPPNRLQSIHWKEGPDYWTRMIAGTVDPDDIRDQDVLTLLFASREDDSALRTLAERCVARTFFAERLVFLDNYLEILRANRRLLLLAYAHDAILIRDGASASTDSSGYAELHSNGLRRANFTNEELVKWLGNEAARVAPISLKLANDLIHSHTKHRDIVPEVRKVFHDALQQLLSVQGAKLAPILDPTYPYSLYHLVYFYGQEDQQGILTRAEDWSWLGPKLITEMKTTPEIIPQVLRIIGDPVPKHPEVPHDFAFDSKKLTGLFGPQVNEALKVIAQAKPEFELLPKWEELWAALAVKRAAILIAESETQLTSDSPSPGESSI